MSINPLLLREGCEARCPGCLHRALPAAHSEQQKIHWLQKALSPWREVLQPIRAVSGEARWGYRHKVRLHAHWQDGWQFGLRVRDTVIAIPRCPVHADSVRAMVAWLTDHVPSPDRFPLAFYTQSGAQATLILKTHAWPDLTWLPEAVTTLATLPGMEGLWLHLHPAAGRRLFAKSGWYLLWGRPRSQAQGLLYGPTAFQQAIPALSDQALSEAERFLAPSPHSAVVDLYCGTGRSVQRWVAQGAAVIGVESQGEAVECARVNAPPAVILRGTCTQRLPQLTEWLAAPEQRGAHRLCYVNPPRTGLEADVTAWIIHTLRPQRLAYLSCNAGSLRRDLHGLTAADYQVARLSPYDFFPQTDHVETLALLFRGSDPPR